MKILKFNTSHGAFALMDGKEQIDQTLKALLDEYTPVSKVSEMTEEQFGEVVNSDDDYGVTMFQNYATTSMAYFDEQINAQQSFSYLIHSLGWYLWENTVEIPHNLGLLDTYPTGSLLTDKNLEVALKWQEAESKTLYSPILLKKK